MIFKLSGEVEKMKNQNSFLLGITALIINLSCGITAVFAQDIPQRITRNFDVKPGGTLTVDSEIGTINVQTADKNEVEVVVTREVAGKLDSIAQKALTDFEVTFEQNNSDIRIEGKFKRDRHYWMKNGHPLRFYFQVTVPSQSNVDLKTAAAGAIHIDEFDGTVRAETSIGNLRFGDIQGTVWGKTGGPGKITLKGCQSDVDVESGVGNIELVSVAGKVIAKTGGPGKVMLRECQSDINVESGVGNIELGSITGKVIAKTGGPGKVVLREGQSGVKAESGIGNIHAEIPTQLMHPWTLRTSGPGKIEVVLSSKTAVNIDAETNGSISSDIPIQVQSLLTEDKLKGTLNGGGPLLKLRTSLGAIRLKKKSAEDRHEKGRR